MGTAVTEGRERTETGNERPGLSTLDLERYKARAKLVCKKRSVQNLDRFAVQYRERKANV